MSVASLVSLVILTSLISRANAKGAWSAFIGFVVLAKSSVWGIGLLGRDLAQARLLGSLQA